MVTASTPTEMTLVAPGGESRSYPLAQVTSVKYVDSAAPIAAVPVVTRNQNSVNPAPMSSPVRPPVRVRPVEEFRTIPAGASIQVRNNEPISSQTAEVGQTFSAVVSQDVMDSSGNLAIPRGSDATLVVRGTNDQGRLQGRSELAIDLGAVTVAGRQYRLDTADFVEQGREGVGANKRTGIFMGGGAAPRSPRK